MLDPVSQQVLAYLNQLRAENGVPQVYYANTGYAKFRAFYMLEHNQIRVYHEGGIPCYYFFNRMGHYHYMEENSAFTSYQGQITPNDVIEGAKRWLNEMVYNDSEYGWIHRDSLLNPCFNYADVHVAYTSNALYMVIAMINARVSWVVKPYYDGKVVRFEGRVHSGVEPTHVEIFRQVLDPRKVEGYYVYIYGDPIAGVVPEPYYFERVETIRPTEWAMNSSYVKVAFPFAPKDRGLYTIFLVGKDKRGIKWTPKSSKYPDLNSCPLMMYTVLV